MVCCMFWAEELGGQRKLHCVSLHWYNCTEGERHAGGSNHPSEDFETHTRLRHVLYSSNSLCVHRLQVQHCMLVWDWQLCPPHCSLEYVQYIWVQYWTVSLVWKRNRNSGHVYMHRELLFLLFFMITHVTWSLNVDVITLLLCYFILLYYYCTFIGQKSMRGDKNMNIFMHEAHSVSCFKGTLWSSFWQLAVLWSHVLMSGSPFLFHLFHIPLIYRWQ